MKQKGIIWGITIFFLTLTFSACLNFSSGDSAGGGSGQSEATAFLVNNETDLRRVGTETGSGNWTLSAYYKQTANITLTYEWIPIGIGSTKGVVTSDADAFKGTYDGGGFSISGLKISNPSSLEVGLFGKMVSTSTVKNVRLIGVDITGPVTSSGNEVGGIAGFMAKYGTVQNCGVSGSVKGNGNNTVGINYFYDVGGVVGQNLGIIENCYSTADVKKITYTNNANSGAYGGIAGGNGGTVRNCYSTGNISAFSDSWTGGIVGFNSGTVEYCYATGNISSGYYLVRIGGITGLSSDNTTVRYCVALDTSIIGGSNIGGQSPPAGRIISDSSSYSPTLSYNYAKSDMTVNGNTVNGTSGDVNGQGITSSQWDSASFWRDTVQFNTTVWSLADNRLPKLAWE